MKNIITDFSKFGITENTSNKVGKVICEPVLKENLKVGMNVCFLFNGKLSYKDTILEIQPDGNGVNLKKHKWTSTQHLVTLAIEDRNKPTDMAVRSASMGTMLFETYPLDISQWDYVIDKGIDKSYSYTVVFGFAKILAPTSENVSSDYKKVKMNGFEWLVDVEKRRLCPAEEPNNWTSFDNLTPNERKQVEEYIKYSN